MLERFNKELKRRSRTIGAFFKDASLLCLAEQFSWIFTRNGSGVVGINLGSEVIVRQDTRVEFTAV